MTSVLKHRIIGAIFLLSLSVIFIPMFFDGEAPRWLNMYSSAMPSAPQFPDIKKPLVEPSLQENTRALAITPHQTERLSWLRFNSKKSDEKPELVTQECWSVRLGSFVKREDALALQAQLQENGFPAYLREIPRTRFIAVFAGPELLRDTAEDMLKTIKDKLGVEGTLVEFDPLA